MTSLQIYELMTAFTVFAVWLGWASYRRQNERLQAMERKCKLTEIERDNYHSAAIWAQVTQAPWVWHQERRLMKLYHFDDTDRAEVVACIASLIFEAGSSVVYWGDSADEIAIELLQGGLNNNRDPRGKFAVPHTFAEVQELLADGRLRHPWLVVVDDPAEERWENLRNQYACGVLMFKLCPESVRSSPTLANHV